MPVYHVNTPDGDRVVEAKTQRDAVDHCVLGDYETTALTPVTLAEKIRDGCKLEQTKAAGVVAAARAAEHADQTDIEDDTVKAVKAVPSVKKKAA